MAEEFVVAKNQGENHPIPPAIVFRLGDKSYDKRKAAAFEVTSLIKALHDAGEEERIASVINLLAQEFAGSRNVHHRKGGLIGLAAASIGLVPDIDRFLHLLIPPVLSCFDDPESRVCYYACESLYNISKVARTCILRYFNQIFDGLCKLFAHVDVDVKNGANLLDRLIKDIVTETESFDIEAFIPLLQKYIKRTKPYIRQLLVSWITVLDAVPDINMLDYLPDFLDGLFNMLGDGNRDIKNAADNCLAEFLREIKDAEVVEFGTMIEILCRQSQSKERSIRITALTWISDFITLGGCRLLMFYSTILVSVMFCISDVENDIKQVAKTASQSLMSLVQSTEEVFELKPLLKILTIELLSDHVITRVTSLNWIYMLHEKKSQEMNLSIGDLLPVLLKTLSDPADEVVLINLQVLARISFDNVQFLRILNALIQLFLEDRNLLETRGALVIRKLCALLDSRSIYMSLSTILSDKRDLEFISLMVQTLNLILLTAPELSSLRKSLKETFQTAKNSSDRQFFIALFNCWCHNPVATFSLCLFTQAYDLSSKLIFKFSEVDVTVGFLMQIDKLVQLLESPIFINLRLQLLEGNTSYQADLLKSLYGLLMILPQSQAYKTLSDRLSTVSSLQMHLGFPRYTENSKDSGKNINKIELKSKIIMIDSNDANKEIDYDYLLNRFENVQLQHSTHKLAIINQNNILMQVNR